jgi:methyl-accepting chemotaxis protein
MSWLNKLTIRLKILILLGIGIAGYLLMLQSNYRANTNNAEDLNQLKIRDFPVLQKADANVVRLDRIVELLQSAVASGEMDTLKLADEKIEEIRTDLAAINKLSPSKEIADLLAAVNNYYKPAHDISLGMIKGTGNADTLEQDVSTMQKNLAIANTALTQYREAINKRFVTTIQTSNERAENSLVINITITIITVVVLSIVGLSIAYSISNNVTNVADSLKDIATGDGDLTKRINSASHDEVGILVKWFNQFVDKLQHAIADVISTLSPLSRVSTELTALSQITSSKTSQQQQSTDQVSMDVENLFHQVQEVAKNALIAATSAKDADGNAKQGREVLQETIVSINNLAHEISRAADAISQLESETRSVGGILDVIQSIAEQTNLLALNAAIEAARAGEHGRGFAVVADEVRTLASRTQNSTKEIQEVINKLQISAQSVVQAMHAGQDRVKNSVDLASRTSETLSSITEKVATISVMNSNIAQATEEQKRSVESIKRTVSGIHDMAAATAHEVGQVNEYCETLADITGRLQKVTSQFRT